MRTCVASQVANRPRRSAVPAGGPVLASKITVPGVPDWAVQRPQLTELIAEVVRWCPLTVLTGPTGAGKTMALELRAAAGPGTVSWVTVDEHNRPGLFWSHVVQCCAGPAQPCRHRCRLRSQPATGPARHHAAGRPGRAPHPETESWAAGLRLAALSMDAHPDPGQFVRDLAAEDSSLTCYLVAEVLNTQPPQVRDMLLCTSILDQVSTEAAAELAGDEQAAGILVALARSNAFIQPAGSGWYRYHTLFGEVLRLTLRCEYPDRVAACTGELPGGTRGTACSPTRCGTPSERVTGAWPPAWSSMIWRSARFSRREVRFSGVDRFVDRVAG